MGEAEEFPLSQRFRHRELDFHHAVIVCEQVWEEERGLVEILARSDLAEVGLGRAGVGRAAGDADRDRRGSGDRACLRADHARDVLGSRDRPRPGRRREHTVVHR